MGAYLTAWPALAFYAFALVIGYNTIAKGKSLGLKLLSAFLFALFAFFCEIGSYYHTGPSAMLSLVLAALCLLLAIVLYWFWGDRAR